MPICNVEQFIDQKCYSKVTRLNRLKSPLSTRGKRLEKELNLLDSYKRLDKKSLQERLGKLKLDFSETDSRLLLIKRLMLGPNFQFHASASAGHGTSTSLCSPIPHVSSQSELERAIAHDPNLTQRELVELVKNYGEKARQIVGFPYRSINDFCSNEISDLLNALVVKPKDKQAAAKLPRICYMDLHDNGQITEMVYKSRLSGRKRSISKVVPDLCLDWPLSSPLPQSNCQSAKRSKTTPSLATPSESGNEFAESATRRCSVLEITRKESPSFTVQAPFKYVAGRDPVEWSQFDGSSDILAQRSSRQTTFTKAPFLLSLDPGFRNFFTCVSLNGDVFVLGAKIYEKLKRYSIKLEVLRTRLLLYKRKNPKAINNDPEMIHLKSRMQQINQLKKEAVHKLHEECLSFLSCADLLFLPESLASSNNEEMKQMNHKGFNEQLLQKCALEGAKVVNVSEMYSTRCCSSCGKFRYVGKDRLFTCTGCGIKCDRDENASWNIFLFAVMRLLKCKDGLM